MHQFCQTVKKALIPAKQEVKLHKPLTTCPEENSHLMTLGFFFGSIVMGAVLVMLG